MKIKLNTGEVIEERLNRAQRLIRLGKASVYIEPDFVEDIAIIDEKKTSEPIEPVEKKRDKKKAKKEKKIESKVIELQKWENS